MAGLRLLPLPHRQGWNFGIQSSIAASPTACQSISVSQPTQSIADTVKKTMLLLSVLFCSIFIIIGGLITISGMKKIIRGISARSWPTAPGLVSQAESKDTSDSESSSREIRVRYTYSVGGQSFVGSVIHPAYGSSSFEGAHAPLEAALTDGRSVRVYYDLSDPSRSTLSVGFYSCSLASVFGGLIFFGAGVGFLGTFWFANAGKMNFADGISFTP